MCWCTEQLLPSMAGIEAITLEGEVQLLSLDSRERAGNLL